MSQSQEIINNLEYRLEELFGGNSSILKISQDQYSEDPIMDQIVRELHSDLEKDMEARNEIRRIRESQYRR